VDSSDHVAEVLFRCVHEELVELGPQMAHGLASINTDVLPLLTHRLIADIGC
jgi:hypothetical protein